MSTAVIDLTTGPDESSGAPPNTGSTITAKTQASSAKTTPETLLPLSYQPTEHDILIGDVVPVTAKIYFQSGYKFFGSILNSLLPAFLSGNADQQRFLCEFALSRIQQAGGRFVQQHPVHKQFFVVPVEQARESVYSGFWGILQAQQQREATALWSAAAMMQQPFVAATPASAALLHSTIHPGAMGAPPQHHAMQNPLVSNLLLQQELVLRQQQDSEREVSTANSRASTAVSQLEATDDSRNQHLLLQKIRQIVGGADHEPAPSAEERGSEQGSLSMKAPEEKKLASKMVETEEIIGDDDSVDDVAARSQQSSSADRKPQSSLPSKDQRSIKPKKSSPTIKTESSRKASKKKPKAKPALSKTSTQKLNTQTKKAKVSKKAKAKKGKGQILNTVDPQFLSNTKKNANDESLPVLEEEPVEEEEENFSPIDQKPLVSKELLQECKTICLGGAKDEPKPKLPAKQGEEKEEASESRRVSPRLRKRDGTSNDSESTDDDAGNKESPSKKACLESNSSEEEPNNARDSKSKRGKKKKTDKPTVDTVWTWVDEQTATTYTHVLHM